MLFLTDGRLDALYRSFRGNYDWFQSPWNLPLSASAIACALLVVADSEPLVPSHFKSPHHKAALVAMETHTELKEALQYECFLLEQSNLFVDRSRVVDFPIHRLLPLQYNQMPSFVALREGILHSHILRRAWFHWTRMEHRFLWVEVSHADINSFLDCFQYAAHVRVISYHAPFSLTHGPVVPRASQRF